MTAPAGKTKVTILTDAYRIKGYVDLVPGARLTDFMREANEFIAVTEAEVFEIQLAGRQVLKAPFIDVNRAYIQVIVES